MIPIFWLGAVHMGRGEWDAGSRYLEEHLTIAKRTGDFRWLHAAQALLAEREILEGHAEAARVRLEGVLDLPGLSEIDTVMVHVVLAWSCLELRNEVWAEELAGDAVRVAEARENQRVLIDALRVEGMVLTRLRHPEQACRSFKRVLAMTDDATYPYPRARALYEYGMMLMPQGEKSQARARLMEALGVFQRLGARKDMERTQQALVLLDQS